MSYQKELQFTQELIKEVGMMVLGMQKDAKRSFKTENDIVTEADFAAEKMVVDALRKAFSEDDIIAEENHHNPLTEKRTWIIDPIDGTINYARGIPLYGVSIGLFENKESVMGCIYLPVFDELYFAHKGTGAFCNKEKIQVSKVDRPEKSIFHMNGAYTTPIFKNVEPKSQSYLNVSSHSMRTRMYGSAVVEAMYVASGKIEAYACDAHLWDFAAANIIVAEAGGMVTRVNGEPYDPTQKDIVYSNGLVHEGLLELINR